MRTVTSMIACQFERRGAAWVCATCGRAAKSTTEHPPTAVCRASRGLGDMVADGLSAVGITKERAQAVASAVGVKDCGCERRQATLNAIGREWLGVGLDAPATVDGERESKDAPQATTAESSEPPEAR